MKLKIVILTLLLSVSSGIGRAAETSRIVSLAPSLTELAFALGVGGQVVAVTNQCDFPGEVRQLAKVGDYTSPNLEAIVVRKPTVVVATEGNPLSLVADLKRKGVHVLELAATRVSDLPAMVRRMGKELGAEKRAGELALRLEGKLKELDSRGEVRRTRRQTFLFAIQFNPLFSVSPDSWLGDLFARGGFENVVPSGKVRYPQLSREWLLAKTPELLFVDSSAFPHANSVREKELAARDELERLLGRKRDLPKVVLLPPDVLVRAGPRMVDGIDFLLKLP